MDNYNPTMLREIIFVAYAVLVGIVQTTRIWQSRITDSDKPQERVDKGEVIAQEFFLGAFLLLIGYFLLEWGFLIWR